MESTKSKVWGTFFDELCQAMTGFDKGYWLGLSMSAPEFTKRAEYESGYERILIIACLVIMCLAIAFVLLFVQAYRDWTFICENTGSLKGYREWPFGLKTGHWYQKSPLEEFIQSEAPNALVYRWTSCAGTGKNIFGKTILYGHGRPGAIMQLTHDAQRKWIDKNDAETVRQLYDLLVSDDQNKLEQRVMDIWKEVLNYKE